MLTLSPTTRASASRVTGCGAANRTASTRPIYSRQRTASGSSSSSASSKAFFARAMSETVQAKHMAARQFARDAKRNQAIAQTAHATIRPPPAANTRRYRVIVEQRVDNRGGALGAQARGGLDQNGDAPRQVLMKIDR